MKELLSSIFNAANERAKNPFIGSLVISWIIFNWKPILFILFSSKMIEDKIQFISMHYNSINNILFLPLTMTIFYILILPYLGLLFDILLSYPISRRNNIITNRQIQIIENRKKLAIEEINLEETQAEYRDRKTHNKHIEDLQRSNDQLLQELQTVKDQNKDTIDQLRLDLNKREEILRHEIENYERRQNELMLRNKDLSVTVRAKDEEIHNLQEEVQNQHLRRRNQKFKSIYRFRDGNLIGERVINGKSHFFDIKTNEEVEERIVRMMMTNQGYDRL